jgi:hypothetical protein
LQAIVLLVGLSAIVLPIAWLVSEVGNRRSLRIGLGIGSIVAIVTVFVSVNGVLTQLDYNSSYGAATKDLVDTTIVEIEKGNVDRVMDVLRRLNLQYQPTYENRARYVELVSEAVAKMKGESVEPSKEK